MGWFEESVEERLAELPTTELIAQRSRAVAVRFFSRQGGILLDSSSFDEWIIQEPQAALRRQGARINLAWMHVPYMATEFSEQITDIHQFRARLNQFGFEDQVTWDLRGRYEVRSHLIAVLGSQIYERLAESSGKQSGQLPKLANIGPADRAFLKAFHDLRDSFEHWDERIEVSSTAKDGRDRDELVTYVSPETQLIGRSTDNEGRAKLTYADGRELLVDLTPLAAARMNSLVQAAEQHIRRACANEVVNFLAEFPEAKWFASHLGSAITHKPMRTFSNPVS